MTRVGRKVRTSRVLVSVRGTLAIAYCEGTLDRPSVENLVDRLRSLASQGVRGFVCSLERVQHVHFQALDPLLRMQQTLHASGGRLVLVDASPYVRQILDFGGVPRHLSLVEDKHQAVWQVLQGMDASLELQTTAT